MMSSAPDSELHQSGRHRKRVSLACKKCRDRKVRCDGGQPACGRCSTRGFECVYAKKYARTRISASYVRELEAKLATLGEHDVIRASALEYTVDAEDSPEMSDDTPSNPSPQMTMTDSRHESAANTANSLSEPPTLPPPHELGPPRQSGGSSPDNNGESAMDTESHAVPDAMGAATTKGSARRQDFYGSSSALSFMRLVEAAISAGKPPESSTAKQTSSQNNAKPGPAAFSYFKPSSHNRYKLAATGVAFYGQDGGSEEDWIVPSRRLADHYVQLYFTYIYSMYPFIHEPSFMAAYNAVWSSEHESEQPTPRSWASISSVSTAGSSIPLDEITNTKLSAIPNSVNGSTISNEDKNGSHLFFCIMNVVFSFGCLFASGGFDTPSRQSASQVYFNRARKHLDYNNVLDATDSGSLILLQALLLIGQYLQATQKPAACWNVVGLAIRVAQELGLHRESQISSRPSLIEQEMCRRLWYGCILMDRTVSMTFGRPLMITQDFKVIPPRFIDDVYITDREIKSPPLNGPPSILSFYEQTLALYDILAEILLGFYDTNDNDGAMEELQPLVLRNILELEGKLIQFRKNLPSYLRIENVNQHGPTAPLRRLTNVLYIRYWHIEIMLYRPVLLPHFTAKRKDKSGSNDSYLQDTMEKAMCKMCVVAAIRLITLVYENKRTPNLPAMWYNIFYVYTSATVLIAAKLQPKLEGELDGESMASAWKMALQSLRLFENHGVSATRCLKMLELMHEKLTSSIDGTSKSVFDTFPSRVDSLIGMNEDSNLLFSMMSDQTYPFSEATAEYYLSDMQQPY